MLPGATRKYATWVIALPKEQQGIGVGRFDALVAVAASGERRLLPLDHVSQLLPLSRVGSEMAQEFGEPGRGDGEYSGGVVALAEEQRGFTAGEFHAGGSVRSA
jgi:hypothetical protein